MNIVKLYKESNSLRLTDLQEEFSKVQPGIDIPTISRMVNGVVRPTEEVEAYIAFKVFASPSDARKEEQWAITSLAEETGLNERFLHVYQIIKEASKDNPATYSRLMLRTGKSRREIQSLISEMREQGVPIVSYTGKTGFWLAEDEADMKNLIGMYEKQAKKSLLIASRLKGSCRGQLQWEGIPKS